MGSGTGPLRGAGLVDRSPSTVVLSRAQRQYVSWTADLLVYTVVLNLFVEFVDGVVIDSFVLSILTAVLLKLMLVVLHRAETAVRVMVQRRGTRAWRIIGGLLVFAILFAGKFVILEVVDVVFGGRVELGHFVEVAVLVLALMGSRALMDAIFARLGPRPEPAAVSPDR